MNSVSSTFSGTFQARLANIEARAKTVGSNITQVCKKTGVARATFERWVQRAPQSITLVDRLELEVDRLEAEHAARQEASAAPESVQ